MKKVLLIAYYFPPLGGDGVQRSVKFVKYLIQKGWSVSVLTVKEDKTFFSDDQFFKEVPPEVTIYRSKCVSPEPLFKMFAKIKLGFLKFYMSRFFIPDLQIGWLFPSFRLAKKVIEKEQIDIVYTTSSPYTAHFIGFLLKTQLKDKMQWVTDFRDPWSQNVIIYKNFLGNTRKKIDAIFERWVLDKSDHIIMVTKSCRTNLIKKFNLEPAKVSVITNGYDEDDFSTDFVRTKRERLRIVYSGSAYGDYTPENFLRAATTHVLPSNPEINVIFVGGSSAWVKDYLIRNNLYDRFSGFFSFMGYVPHEEAVRLVLDADLLVLPIPNSIPYNMTGKIFEYMRSGVPILAVVPVQGDAAEVIRSTGTGFVVDPDDLAEIGKAINNLYVRWKEKSLKIEPDVDEIKKYRRSVLTDQLIEVFNKLAN